MFKTDEQTDGQTDDDGTLGLPANNRGPENQSPGPDKWKKGLWKESFKVCHRKVSSTHFW